MRETYHNNLGPRHTPIWVGATILGGLAILAVIIPEQFQLQPIRAGFSAYILLGFTVIVLAFRPAWRRTKFWLGVGVLFGVHALAGLVLLVFPIWQQILHPFLTIVALVDLLLTISLLWRFTVKRT